MPFTAKNAVKKHAAAIRRRYPRGHTITAPEDVAFVRDLLICNVEAEQKGEGGVARFYWDKSPSHSTDCFWVERISGPPTDFGVAASLDGVGRLNRASLRQAVRADIDAYRRRRLGDSGDTFISDYSGKEFSIDEAAVDHVTPFEEIVSTFFEARGVDVDTWMLTLPVDAQSLPEWRDVELIEDFRTFHATFPLRLVHRDENAGAIRREQRMLN